jgi:tetratricopeptide (TPR) repeat protein
MHPRAKCLIAVSLMAPPLALAADPALAAAAAAAAQGDCAAADQTIRPYLQGRGKTDPDAYRLMADCYGKTGQAMQAIKTLREGIAALGSSAVLQRSLGEALFRQDPKDAEAGELLRRASQALPGDPEAGHYYAQWAHVARQDEICVRKEQAALRTPGLNDLALLQMYTLLGMCQSRIEAVEGAKASFLKARAINLSRTSFDPMAAYQYVQLLTRLGEDKEAMLIVDEILQRIPAFAPAHLERAKSFEHARRPDAAIEAARAALAGEGNDAATERAAHGVLARCYFLAGNLAAAEQEQEWIQQHPNPETRR